MLKKNWDSLKKLGCTGLLLFWLISGEKVSSLESIDNLSKPYLADSFPSENLESEVGIDYTNLLNFLKAGKWKEADNETKEVMLKAAHEGQDANLDENAINKFPCTDLRTIDQLWVKYSNGHFGFSVQKKIWLQLGGKNDASTEVYLGERLGWHKDLYWNDYSDRPFNINFPEGFLPYSQKIVYSEHGEYIDNHYEVENSEWFKWDPQLLIQRLVTCKI